MGAGHDERDTSGSFETSGGDHVSLSAQERQTLAHLEERIRLDDPDFATRMRGRSWRWIRQVAGHLRPPQLPAWLGPVLLVLGLAATLLVVSSLPWLSILTLGVAVVGAHRIGGSVRTRLQRAREQQAATGHD